MIDMSCHANFDGERLRHIVAQGSGKALVRAAAYLRGAAKRKVRRGRKKSLPGQPPIAHTPAFRASILFNVDAGRTTAVIGPEKFGGTPKSMQLFGLSSGGARRENDAGQPLPDILEHGGQPIAGPEPFWWSSVRSIIGRPSGNTEQHITRFFKHLGYGPGYWGTSAASVRRKSKRTGAASRLRASLPEGGKSRGWIYKRYSRIKRKNVFLQNIPTDTIQQAVKVKNVIMQVFGRPYSTARHVAPRPLMGPTLNDSNNKIAEFWRDSARS